MLTGTSTLDDWPAQRRRILAGFEAVAGPLPDLPRDDPPTWETLESVDCGGYTRHSIRFASQPGGDTPAYLLLPHGASAAAPVPGILALQPTDRVGGSRQVVGLPEPTSRAYAAQLARRGLAVIAPTYPMMGDYEPDLASLGFDSGTMKAVWDNLRAVDLLVSLAAVDGPRVGAIGHSLGGHNAIFTAMYDQRLHAVVSSCGFDSLLDYRNGDRSAWSQELYMARMAHFTEARDIPFDFDALIATLAPRAFLASAPLRDDNFDHASAATCVERARPVYALFDGADHLQIVHPDCGHDFPVAIREGAYTFLIEALRG